MNQPNYYCSVEGVWRRTPCVHEACRRLDYTIPKSQMKLGKKSHG